MICVNKVGPPEYRQKRLDLCDFNFWKSKKNIMETPVLYVELENQALEI